MHCKKLANLTARKHCFFFLFIVGVFLWRKLAVGLIGHLNTMDAEEFRKRGCEMVDYIADYMTTIKSRHVTPDVEPGYLRHLLPEEAPNKGEDWTDIMADVERAIMPGVSWKVIH